MKLIFFLIVAGALLSGACVPISSGQIRARDLVDTVPSLSALAPETVLGFTPLPGTQRVLHGRELMWLARKQALELGVVPDVCVERAVRPIHEDEIRTALLHALELPAAQLEILDFSKQSMPEGALHFERSALGRPSSRTSGAPVFWRGRLIYDERHTIAIWAKVRILVQRQAFVAAEDIHAGTAIATGQVKAVTVREFPSFLTSFDSPGQIAGRLARRNLAAGQRFEPAMIEEAQDVYRGDIVQVRVIDGLATLSLEGIAVSSGKAGETILIHNARSGRNFKAVIEQKGKALVLPAPSE